MQSPFSVYCLFFSAVYFLVPRNKSLYFIRVSCCCQSDWFLIFPGVTRYIFDKAGHNPADRSTKSEWKYDDRFWLIHQGLNL